MNDPYKVLGIAYGSSMERVDAAYRELAAQYQNNPAKMNEINEAYDTIVLGKAPQNYASDNQYYYSSTDYTDIRNRINTGNYDDAQILLDGIPYNNRNAEWYYLKGLICQNKGWLEEAYSNFSTAKSMDPSNSTYASACDNADRARNGGYKSGRSKRHDGAELCAICSGAACLDSCCDCDGCCDCDSCCSCDDCDFCSICSGLICADSCCECMGGDLISCC